MSPMMSIMAAAPATGAPGDIRANEREIARLIARARERGARLLALPELCLSASGCGSLFEQDFFNEEAERAALRLSESCRGLCCLIGLPLRDGAGRFSAMLAVEDGRLLGLWLRGLPLPHRPGCPRTERDSLVFGGEALPVLNGRLLRLSGGESLALSFSGEDRAEEEAAACCLAGADICVFPAARPALAGGAQARRIAALRASARGCVCVMLSAGANESSTDCCFDGQALIARDGLLAEAAPFAFGEALSGEARPWEGPMQLPPPEPAAPYAPPPGPQRSQWRREAVEIAAQALRLRMRRIGTNKLLLGLSGGLDSAMALLICCRACELAGLDPGEAVLPYALPGPGSGSRTQANSRDLAAALGLTLRRVSISRSVALHLEEIGHAGQRDTAFENAQARERTQILMDLANLCGGLMVGTGDLSELALGFTTFGGDHLSMYCVNGGLYKSAIRLILSGMADEDGRPALSAALRAILDTPVSPELLPGEGGSIAQRTEDIVGPYELNDFFLHHLLSGEGSPRALVALAEGAFGGRYGRGELIDRLAALLRRFFAAQFKRSCMPDGPQILPVSLSPRGGFLMPSDASAALWLRETDRMKEGD